MKSEHRHQLETNALAQRLDVLVHRVRPYAATILGVAVAIIAVMFLWSYWSGASAGRQDAAWDMFNQSLSGSTPDLEQLRLAAQDYPGTPMQEVADVTWADGQLWMAARDYLYNRPAAAEALSRAQGAYETVIQSSDDERLVNRAQLGLARVYEMQGKLEQAREAYLKVRGAYEEYAKLQAERLADAETQDNYAWLASARPPAPRAPSGPGTPGRRPEFLEGELALPSGPTTSPDTVPVDEDSFENLLQGLKLDLESAGSPETDPADRYAPGATPTEGQAPQTGPPLNNPATDAENPPSTDAPAAGTADSSTPDKPAE